MKPPWRSWRRSWPPRCRSGRPRRPRQRQRRAAQRGEDRHPGRREPGSDRDLLAGPDRRPVEWYDLLGREEAKDLVLESLADGRNTLESLNHLGLPVLVVPDEAEAVRVANDTGVWGETYDSAMDDIFQVQTDIATKVIEALGVVLVAGHSATTVERPTSNQEAYQAYLRGQDALAREPTGDLAQQMFERAVELDPEYAQLLEYIGYELTSIDELVTRSGLTPAEVSSMLLQLELGGHIASSPGGLYNRLK